MLDLCGSRFGPTHPAGVVQPTIDASGAKINGPVRLANGFASEGEVSFLGAEIGGNLECMNSYFRNLGRPALTAGSAKIAGSAHLDNGFSAEGEVSFYGAEIGGDLNCDNGSFNNPGQRALTAALAKIAGNARLGNDFGAEGEVSFYRAEIGGDVVCAKGTFTNTGKTALTAAGANVKGAVFLSYGFRADGEVQLDGAEIAIHLQCNNGVFRNPGKFALIAERAKIHGTVFLNGCSADGEVRFSADGEVRFLGAEIGGDLECHNGSFNNPGQPALTAGSAKIAGSAHLDNGFSAEGEVSFYGAEIGGDVVCRKSAFANTGKTALTAGSAKIGGAVSLGNGFNAKGEIQLTRTDIRGDLSVVEADLSAVQLKVDRTAIGGSLFFKDVTTGPNTQIDFSDTTCNVLVDDEKSWPPAGNLILEGFTYRLLRTPRTASSRLDWLRRRLPAAEQKRNGEFRPQPYRKLAEVLRAQGHDDDAKKILIGMAEDRRKWGGLSRWSRGWEWILGATIDYGYRPFRAGIWLLVLWLIGLLLFWAGYWAQVMVPSNKDAFAEFAVHGVVPGWYEPFSSLIYAVDTALPVISFGQRDRWLPAGHPCGTPSSWDPNQITCRPELKGRLGSYTRAALTATLPIYRWVHLALGWFLASLFVAGITGLVKRE
jgi:hypothetical protein